MIRNLSLILDKDGEISLTLESMDSIELDKFIMKNFGSSEEVRNKYASIINPYLEQHKSFLDDVYNRTGRKFRGSIVITELQNDNSIQLKRVFYKGYISIYKQIFNSLMQNRDFVIALRNYDSLRQYSNSDKNYKPLFRIGKGKNPIYPDIADYGESDRIRYAYLRGKDFEPIIADWKAIKRDRQEYYDAMRAAFSYYNNIYCRDHVGLKKVEDIAKQMKNEIEREREANKFDEALIDTNSVPVEEPVRYISGADEDGYPGDLERNDNSQFRTDDEEARMYKLRYRG